MLPSIHKLKKWFYKYLYCNRNYQKKFENLKKQFANTYNCSNLGNKKFIFVIRRCVPIWIHGKFNEALPEKENFYSHLNMEDITDVDYKKRLQGFWNENFKWIIWIISSNLYIIASSCIWELLQYASWNITRPCSFCTSPGLAWHRVLKK